MRPRIAHGQLRPGGPSGVWVNSRRGMPGPPFRRVRQPTLWRQGHQARAPDRDDLASADHAEYGGRIDATPESDHHGLSRKIRLGTVPALVDAQDQIGQASAPV